MRQRKFKPPQRKTQRRWRVPPALTQGSDVFEGLSVLDDVPGELGLVLWQSLRDALLWSDADPATRGGLFAPGAEPARVAALMAAGVPDEIEQPLSAIAALLGSPAATREESVALACRRISQWADASGRLATALAFAQAAALVTPGDSAAAYTVGRLARRRAEYARAESWYRRTIALARQSGDWPTYAQAFVGLGNLYAQRGNFPAAKRFYVRALRAAGRNSLHEIEGMALHEMFGISIEMGAVRDAERLAREAFEKLHPGHARIPILAHDVAYFWITQGHFARAQRVYESLLPYFPDPAARLSLLGNLARAAGGAGDAGAYLRAWDEARVLLGSRDTEETAARALLELAHGAASLRRWDQAEDAARQALELSTRRQEAKVRLTAESLLEAVRRHSLIPTEAPSLEREVVEAADALAADFVHSLQMAGA